jgi:hypothetical protein
VVPARPYTRAELQFYLEYARLRCRATIAALTDEKARQGCTFPWAELLLDNMRHVPEHAAQLNMFLGQQTGWQSGWVSAQKPAAS